MTDIVFPKAGKHGDGVPALLQLLFGIAATKIGNDVHVTASEAARGFSDQEYITLHPQMNLVRGKEKEIASRLYGVISEAIKIHQPKAPESIRVPRGPGIPAKVAATTRMVAAAPDAQLLHILENEALPLMRNDLGAQSVTPVSVDVERLQSALSFSKVALLAERFDADKANQLQWRRALLTELCRIHWMFCFMWML